MTKKKAISRKAVLKKDGLTKIAEKVGELAGQAMNKKDRLVNTVTSAIKSVKASIHNMTAEEKEAGKAIKKSVRKISQKKGAAVKKVAPIKKTIKKAIKKAVKKSRVKK